MKEITFEETESIIGGLDPVTTSVVVGIGIWVMANWPDIKKGFTDGLVKGLNAF